MQRNTNSTMRMILAALSGALMLGGATPKSWAQCTEYKMLGSNPSNYNYYGRAIAMDGDVAVIGQTYDSTNYVENVEVFRFDGVVWNLEQIIADPGQPASSSFGYAVDVDGDVLIIGDPYNNSISSSAGAAYVYRFNGVTWELEQQLLNSLGQQSDNFGTEVAVSDDSVVVGSPNSDGAALSSGIAFGYRFDGTSWILAQTFSAPTPPESDYERFGSSIDLDDGALAIGEPEDGLSNQGQVHVYHDNGQSWDPAIQLTVQSNWTHFGRDLALSGDALLVGSSSGAAYIYRFDGADWTYEDTMVNSDGLQNISFGSSVSLDGNLAAVGAQGDDMMGTNAGAAYAFAFDNGAWHEVARFVPNDLATYDEYGGAVAIGGASMLVGAKFHDADGLSSSGAVYLYQPIADCNANGILDCQDIADGTSTDFNANLVPDECETLAYNVNLDIQYDTIADAIWDSSGGHLIEASPLLFDSEPDIDFLGRNITLRGMTDIDQPAGGLYELTNGVRLETSTANSITLGGELRVNMEASADVRTGTLIIEPSGEIVCRPESTLGLAGATHNGGSMIVLNSTLFADDFSMTGTTHLSGSFVFADSMTVDPGGRLNTSGEIYSDITNDQDVFCLGDTLVVGDYVNNAVTTIQVGTLTIVGNLTNMGTILGDLAPPPLAAFDDDGSGEEKALAAVAAPGDGMSISGDYVAGPLTSLNMPDALLTFSVGGNFDLAINNHNNFDLSLATLRLDGLAGAIQTLEAMSLNIGDDPAGFDRSLPGHYPIGTLHIGPNATTVNLIDNHDNDQLGQQAPEALYVETLIVASGARLNTNGMMIYYSTLQLDGTVDDPMNLMMVADIPNCPADSDGDGIVGITDFLAVLAYWGPCGTICSSDIDDDGLVGIADFLAVLANWGDCP